MQWVVVGADDWQKLAVMEPINSSPQDKKATNLADDIFSCIFLNENVWISIKISLKFVPKGPIDNKPVLFFCNGLAPNRRQAITYTNVDPVDWHIYGALVWDELKELIILPTKCFNQKYHQVAL